MTYETKSESLGDGLPVDGRVAEPARSVSGQIDSTSASHDWNQTTAKTCPAADGAQIQGIRDSEPLPSAMADLHLSGSDPRMFPGILTRDHRSGSLRNLAQADDWPVDSSEAPGEEDDM